MLNIFSIVIIQIVVSIYGQAMRNLLTNTDNLLAYYPLLTSQDTYSNTYDGSLSNTVPVVNRNLLTQAQKFSLSSSYFSIPISLLNGKNNFTIILWIQRNFLTGSSSDTILHATKNGDTQLELNTLYFTYKDVSYSIDSQLENEVDNNNWCQIGLAVSENAFLIYLNGQLIHHQYVNLSPLDLNSGSIVFGQKQSAVLSGFSNGFKGSMSDIRIYSQRILSSEIQNLYDNEKDLCNFSCLNCTTDIFPICLLCRGDRQQVDNQCLCPKDKFDDYLSTNCQTTSSFLTNTVIVHYPLAHTNDEINSDTAFIISQKSTNRNQEQNKAYQFKCPSSNGAPDAFYAQLPISPYINGNSQISFGIWIKIEENIDINQGVIFSLANSNDFNHLVFGFKYLIFAGTQTFHYEAEYELKKKIGQWQHILLVVDSNQYTIYQNGASIGTYNKNNQNLNVDIDGFILGQTQGSIGGDFQYNACFDGSMSDFKVYSGTKNQNSAKQIYQAEKRYCPSQCTNCIQETNTCTSCIGLNRDLPNCQCTYGYYNDGVSDDCEICDPQCETCQNNPDECLICNGQFREAPTCDCEDGYFDDGVSDDCQPCGDINCKVCQTNNGNFCLIAQDGYHAEGGQVYSCSEGEAIIEIKSLNQISIELQFLATLIDSTQSINTYNNELCKHLFTPLQLAKFGPTPTCKISSTSLTSTIFILFNDYKVEYQQFDEIQIQEVFYKNSCQQNYPVENLNYSYIEADYTIIQEPNAKLIGETTIALCQDIKIKLTEIQNDGYHDLQSIIWQVSNVNPIKNIDHINDINNQLSQFNDKTAITIEKYTLDSFSTYTLQSTLTNYLGKQKTISIELKVLSDIFAKIDILETESPYQIQPNLFYYINFQAYVLKCVENSDKFEITYPQLNYEINQMTDSNYNTIDKNLQNNNVQANNLGQGQFIIEPYIFDSGNDYYLQFQPNLIQNGNNLGISTNIKIKVQQLDYLVYIKGGNRLQSYSQKTIVQGIYSDLNVENNQQSGFSLQWECINLITAGPCQDTNGDDVTINQSVDFQEFQRKTFEPYTTLKFTFKASKNSIELQDSVILNIVELDSPNLSLNLPDNILTSLINPNDDIFVEVLYDGEVAISDRQYHIILQYNLEKVAIKSYQYNQFSFKVWDLFNDFDDNNYKITAKVSLYDPQYTMPAFATFTINLNEPPKNGLLQIVPTTGISAKTNFKISAQNFVDTDNNLQYEFYYYLNEKDFNYEKQQGNQPTDLKRQLLQSFNSISEFNTYLPSSQNIDSQIYNITILVLVKDKFNGISNITKTVYIEENNQLQDYIDLYNQAAVNLEINVNWSDINTLCILAQQLKLAYDSLSLQQEYNQLILDIYDQIILYQNQIIVQSRKFQIQKSLNILLELIQKNKQKNSINIDNNIEYISNNIEQQLAQYHQFKANNQLHKCNSQVDQKIQHSQNILGKSVESLNNLITIQQQQQQTKDKLDTAQSKKIISEIEKIANFYNKMALPNSDPIIYSGNQVYTSIQKQTLSYYQSLYQKQVIQTKNQNRNRNRNLQQNKQQQQNIQQQQQNIQQQQQNKQRQLQQYQQEEETILDVQYSYYEKNLLIDEDFPYKNQSNPIQYYSINNTETEAPQEFSNNIEYAYKNQKTSENTVCISQNKMIQTTEWSSDSCTLLESKGRVTCICNNAGEVVGLVDDFNGIFSNVISDLGNTFNGENLDAFLDFEYYKSTLFYLILVVGALNIYLEIIGYRKDRKEQNVMTKVNKEQKAKRRQSKLLIKQNKVAPSSNFKIQNQQQQVPKDQKQKEKAKTQIGLKPVPIKQESIKYDNYLDLDTFQNPLSQLHPYQTQQFSLSRIGSQRRQTQKLQDNKLNQTQLNVSPNSNQGNHQLFPNVLRKNKRIKSRNFTIKIADSSIALHNDSKESASKHNNTQIFQFDEIPPESNRQSQPKTQNLLSILSSRRGSLEDIHSFPLNKKNSQEPQKKPSKSNLSTAVQLNLDKLNEKMQSKAKLSSLTKINDTQSEESEQKNSQIKSLDNENLNENQNQNENLNYNYNYNQNLNENENENENESEYHSIYTHNNKRGSSEKINDNQNNIEETIDPELQKKFSLNKLTKITSSEQNLVKKISIWNTFLIFHQFFSIYFVYSLRKSRPSRFAVFFLKQYLSLGISALYWNWTSSQLETIIFNIIILFLTTFPVFVVQIILVSKIKIFKFFGALLYFCIVLLSFWITFISAADMGLNKSNEWAISYVSAFFFDFSATQSFVSALKNWALNRYGQNNQLVSMIIDQEIINYYYFTYK